MWRYYCKPNRYGRGPWVWAIYQPPTSVVPGRDQDIWSMNTIPDAGAAKGGALARVVSFVKSKQSFGDIAIENRISEKVSDGYVHIMDVEAPLGSDGFERLEDRDSDLVPFIQIGDYITRMAESAWALRGGSSKSDEDVERWTLYNRSPVHWEACQEALESASYNSATSMKGATSLALEEIVVNFMLKHVVGLSPFQFGQKLTLDAYELITDQPCPVW